MPHPAFSAEQRSLTVFLVRMRIAAGITQVELAARLARPQSFVSKYERGERRLDTSEFAQIVEALSRDPVDAFATIYAEWRGGKAEAPQKA